MNISVHLQIRDARLRIPTEDYDEVGNVIGENPNFSQQMEEAQGKFFVRLICEEGGERYVIESADGTDIKQLCQQAWNHASRSVSDRFSRSSMALRIRA